MTDHEFNELEKCLDGMKKILNMLILIEDDMEGVSEKTTEQENALAVIQLLVLGSNIVGEKIHNILSDNCHNHKEHEENLN